MNAAASPSWRWGRIANRWGLLLIAIAAILVSLLGSGTAFAANFTANETCVGASAPAAVHVAGMHEPIAAATTTYDNPVALVRGAQAGAATLGWARRDSGALPSLARKRVAAKTAIRVRPPLSIPKGQFGAKWGKHAMDYGLDPGDAAARAGFMSRIRNVHLNPDEVRLGKFRDYDEAFMFRQGEDLLITRTDGTFVSMYPGASTSSWFKKAEVFPH